ncbi:hypothetical protein ACP70R_035662 [Stipagrostis hirtigluma subsp. patula]
MAVPLLLLLLLAMFTGSEAAFCVAKPGLNPTDPRIQSAIDYACSKGADCSATMQGGPCNGGGNKVLVFSYIANSYFQNNSPKGATCDFNGLATLTTTDPSAGSCKFASGPSSVGTGGGMGAGAGTGGMGAGTGAGTGMGGTGAGTGTGMGGTGAGTGAGTGTGAGAGITSPGSSTTGTGGALSPPFGGAYGPSGSSTDYNAAGRQAVTAAVLLAAAAPLLFHLA